MSVQLFQVLLSCVPSLFGELDFLVYLVFCFDKFMTRKILHCIFPASPLAAQALLVSPHPSHSIFPQYIISLARVFRGSLGSLSSVLGHEVWCKISRVIHYWSWSFGGLRCQGLLVCVCLALYHVSLVWATFDLGLESCSGPQEGKQSGAIFVEMEEEWMGWDVEGPGGPGCCKQTFLLYAIVCTYHSLTCAHLGA